MDDFDDFDAGLDDDDPTSLPALDDDDVEDEDLVLDDDDVLAEELDADLDDDDDLSPLDDEF